MRVETVNVAVSAANATIAENGQAKVVKDDATSVKIAKTRAPRTSMLCKQVLKTAVRKQAIAAKVAVGANVVSALIAHNVMPSAINWPQQMPA